MLVIVWLCIVSLMVLISFVCLCAYDVVVLLWVVFCYCWLRVCVVMCLNVVVAFGYGLINCLLFARLFVA